MPLVTWPLKLSRITKAGVSASKFVETLLGNVILVVEYVCARYISYAVARKEHYADLDGIHNGLVPFRLLPFHLLIISLSAILPIHANVYQHIIGFNKLLKNNGWQVLM